MSWAVRSQLTRFILHSLLSYKRHLSTKQRWTNQIIKIGKILSNIFGCFIIDINKKIEEELNCDTYFCDPYCAWQKGTNENTNGLLREFYPKGMDLSKVDRDELVYHLTIMNDRTRKCLQYKTPKEAMFGI